MNHLPFSLAAPLPALLLFGGKGGVGKTTIATATALRLADEGPVRLLSTDPAHSLRDSLAEAALPDTLTVEEFSADTALDAFRAAHRATLHEIVRLGTLFDATDIERLLDLSLPGLDEMMAFIRLADLLADDDDGVIVVDTAPTGHTLRLLHTPDQFSAWVNVLDVMLDKHRYMRSVFGNGASDTLDDFVAAMFSKAERVRDAFRDEALCRFFVVAQAEPLVLHETQHIVQQLQMADIVVQDIIFNQWPPSGGRQRLKAFANHSAVQGQSAVWTVPAVDPEPRGPARLRNLLSDTTRLPYDRIASAPTTTPPHPPKVSLSVACPRGSLVFVGGKGGVGKTTMATATALRLAETAGTPNRPVLLTSTDPAHSLHSLLDESLEHTPRPIGQTLWACEIDAEAQFESLRSRYAQAVRQFFDRTGGADVDLTYDRPVMNALMDLAPPGIDEVMGLVALMDFMDERPYTTCVVDTAPTGHLLRLLEMPGAFASWIRAFFRILRKYRTVLHLPRLTDRLVHLSKQVKRLQKNMRRSEETTLLVVTLPTEVAAAETETLIERAHSLGLPVGPLVINRVAATDAAAKRRARHAVVLNHYRRCHAALSHAVVHEGAPPDSRSACQKLGRDLFPRI
ncbi:ArsA family ATPase [Salisaeta longa]|uniref:ArsA family ATPase n=1 Tax=Salisaeta longa TaxID=503170 RepID=UPI0003B564E8|nr:ArsA family ATPase [Salisaeta longa]